MRYLDAAHTIIDAGDGRMIPTDPRNSDYAAILAAGTEIAAYEPPAVDLYAYAAAKRYSVETGGIVSGMFGPLLTDRATQSALGRTIQSIDIGIVAAPIKFKAASGFAMLDRSALVAISTVVAAHVQAAFSIEGDVVAAIDAGTITTTVQIDAAAWPSNS